MFSLIPRRSVNPETGLAPRSDHPVSRFRDEMDRMFEQFFQGWMTPFQGEPEAGWNWRFDVREEDGHVVVNAEMPGFEPDEINVQLSGRNLTIRAEKNREKTEDGENGHAWHTSQTVH